MLSACRYFGVLPLILLSASRLTYAAPVNLHIQETEAHTGGTVDIPLIAEKAQGMGSLEFEVTFDPQAVEFVSLEQAELLPSALVSSNLIEPGRLVVALVSSEKIQGEGSLLTLKFRILSDVPGPVTIQIEKPRAWEHGTDLFEMLASSQPGQITIIGGPSIPRLYWMIGAIGLLIVAGLVLLLLNRKRQVPAAGDFR